MIPNLRDVGETINIIYGQEIMHEGILYRGGTVNELFDETELPDVSCILSLRTGKDKRFNQKHQIHIPAVDTVENYLTSNGKVRGWANRVLAAMNNEIAFPILIHCTAGKDRTGVIIALILLAIDIHVDIIEEEYLQTKGVKGSNNIKEAIQGIGKVEEYIYDLSIIDLLKKRLRK